MIALVKAGVELAYETMVEAGIKESLHTTNLFMNFRL